MDGSSARPSRSDYGNVAILAELTAAQNAEKRYLELAIREEEARDQIQAERRFRQLLEAAPDAIIEVDDQDESCWVNAGVEKLSGYRRDELLGQKLEILVPSELRDKHIGHRSIYWTDPVTRPMGTGLNLHVHCKDGSQVRSKSV